MITFNVINEILAYHGSYRKFDKFKNDFIGKGIGLSKFGYGFYFNDKKNVIENRYKDENSLIYEVELLPREDEYLLWDLSISKQPKYIIEKINELYNNRPTNVLAFSWKKIKTELDFTNNDSFKGKDFYKFLVENLYSEKSASQHLLKFGIKGIKAKDQEDSFNYIIFNEDDILIKEIK